MRAFLTGAERIELAVRLCVPYSLMVLLFLLDLTAAPYPISIFTSAPFMLMALYYWSVHRPEIIPAWLVFGAAVILDILGGFPIGLNALLYILVRWLLVDQSRFLLGQGFVITWLGFVVVSFTVLSFQWLLMSIVNLQFIPINGAIEAFIVGCLFFPLVSTLLRLTHKVI